MNEVCPVPSTRLDRLFGPIEGARLQSPSSAVPRRPPRPPWPIAGTATAGLQALVGGSIALALMFAPLPALAWEPNAPVEMVVPAGTGGGADQMARFIQKLIVDHKLMSQPLTVVNKSGDSGVEGLLYLKGSGGNPNRLIITLSNMFTAPLASGADFSWRDITPVQMLALDQFVLWVNGASPYRVTSDLVDALRRSPPGSLSLGGTGSKQEDQIISVMLEAATGSRITYRPLKGGGDVARALAVNEVDMTVNNPIEAEKLWREGAVRPLCVFDGRRLEYPAKVTATQSWADLPTCMSFGVPVQYLMLRGIFTSPGATPEQVAYYNQLLDRVRALPEWKEFMERGAFKQTVMKGPEFIDWLDKAANFHRVLMREARFKLGSTVSGPAVAASQPKR